MSNHWERVAAVFEAAVVREPTERLPFVREACADDSDVRRQVEAMLAEVDRPVVLDRPVGEAIAELLDDDSPVVVGTQLGAYRVESLLGVGGIGEVYRATDTVLGRQVAIKILPADLAADPERLARFRREAKVLAALNHPNVGLQRPIPAHQAVVRSIPLLRAVSARMVTDGGCAFACHAQPITAMAIDSARARGWTALSSEVESAQSAALMTAFGPQLLQLREGGGQPDAQVYLTMMMAAHKEPSTRATDTIVHYLAGKQRRDGNWRGVGATRAPMQDGDFSRTAMAIRALTVYAIPARSREYTERVARAVAWLSAQNPQTTEDRVMQLLGLHWAGADARVRQSRTRELQASQRSDGGWAQTPHLASDAYATGQVLYTLRELGVPAADAALQRGAAYLLRTQRDDGSWYVKSRAMKIQPYFESGFPHGHDQWISQAATAWATMGLTVTVLDEPAAITAGL